MAKLISKSVKKSAPKAKAKTKAGSNGKATKAHKANGKVVKKVKVKVRRDDDNTRIARASIRGYAAEESLVKALTKSKKPMRFIDIRAAAGLTDGQICRILNTLGNKVKKTADGWTLKSKR